MNTKIPVLVLVSAVAASSAIFSLARDTQVLSPSQASQGVGTTTNALNCNTWVQQPVYDTPSGKLEEGYYIQDGYKDGAPAYFSLIKNTAIATSTSTVAPTVGRMTSMPPAGFTEALVIGYASTAYCSDSGGKEYTHSMTNQEYDTYLVGGKPQATASDSALAVPASAF